MLPPLLCLLLLPTDRSYAQSPYLPLLHYPDQTTIERVVKRRRSRPYPLLVYQPALQNDRSVTSVLLLQEGASTTYWLIRRGTLLTNGVLARGATLFTYSGLAHTGAIKPEGGLAFVPPVMYGLREQVIYADDSCRFFFEVGHPVSYVPDAGRERYRRAWVKQIRQAVEHLL
jgi:hypothetical protein